MEWERFGWLESRHTQVLEKSSTKCRVETRHSRSFAPSVSRPDLIKTRRGLDNIIFIVEYKFKEHHVSQ